MEGWGGGRGAGHGLTVGGAFATVLVVNRWFKLRSAVSLLPLCKRRDVQKRVYRSS